MTGKLTWLALVMTCLLQPANGEPGYFSEVHLGIEADARLLSVTVVAREAAVWRLWPEEVKVENRLGNMEYLFKYQANYTLSNTVRAVSSNAQILPFCQTQMGPLLVAPKVSVPEVRRTVVFDVPVEQKEARRITLRAGDGMAIRDVRVLRKIADTVPAERITLDAATRTLYVQLAYRATYSVDLGPSDLATEFDLQKGELRIRPLKAGFITLQDFASIGRITPPCWAQINERYNGSPLEPAATPNLNVKRAFVVFPIPEHAPRTIHFKPAPGLTVEKIEELE